MILIPKSNWQHFQGTAVVKCLNCNKRATLSKHVIELDGTVKPSLVCPYADCNFHEFVKLEEWIPKSTNGD